MKTQTHKKLRTPTIRVRAPKGFTTKVVGDNYNGFQVYLLRKLKKGTKKIGTVDLEPRFYAGSPNVFETHSRLQKKYRGKHLGAFLYARAIKFCLDHGYRVESSGLSSDMAIRVWKSRYLRRHFYITQKHKNLPQWRGPVWVARVKRK